MADASIKETWLTRAHFKDGVGSAVFVLALTSALAILEWSGWGHASSWMPASRESVFQDHQWWKLWTSVFVHGDPGHLLSNSLLLFVFSEWLVAFFGTRTLGWALFFGGLINAVVLRSMPAESQLIGASGVVFWMGGAWLTLYFFIHREKTLFQRFLRVTGVTLAIFLPSEAFRPQTSYAAHAWGFLFGVLWGIGYFLVNKNKFRAAEVWETPAPEPEFEEPISAESLSDPWRPAGRLPEN